MFHPFSRKSCRNWVFAELSVSSCIFKHILGILDILFICPMIDIALGFLYLSNIWYAVTKKSLAASVPLMKKEIGFTNKNLGECSANFSILYGSFKLIGGVMTDIFSANALFSLGLLFGSIINLVIPFIHDAKYISYIWGFNGLLQGVGGPASSKIVLDNVPSNRKTTIWSNLLTVSHTS